jgi:hypothetical protein
MSNLRFELWWVAGTATLLRASLVEPEKTRTEKEEFSSPKT